MSEKKKKLNVRCATCVPVCFYTQAYIMCLCVCVLCSCVLVKERNSRVRMRKREALLDKMESGVASGEGCVHKFW